MSKMLFSVEMLSETIPHSVQNYSNTCNIIVILAILKSSTIGSIFIDKRKMSFLRFSCMTFSKLFQGQQLLPQTHLKFNSKFVKIVCSASMFLDKQ